MCGREVKSLLPVAVRVLSDSLDIKSYISGGEERNKICSYVFLSILVINSSLVFGVKTFHVGTPVSKVLDLSRIDFRMPEPNLFSSSKL